MIRLENVAWQAGAFGFSDLSFTVPGGCYGVLTGRTGEGKTTLLELICGLRRPLSGRIWVGDREVTGLPPGARGLGYVPQDGALFPTLNVREQIGFALSIRKSPPDGIKRRVEELAAALGVTHLLDRRPDRLSGGERQRVALGRALAASPRVLLLDEPLSALDDDTREQLLGLLQCIHRETAVTVLHVTHHRMEAQRLAGLMLNLEGGRIREGLVGGGGPASEKL